MVAIDFKKLFYFVGLLLGYNWILSRMTFEYKFFGEGFKKGDCQTLITFPDLSNTFTIIHLFGIDSWSNVSICTFKSK